ncbi:hypothetical protein GCM10025858_01130 [Alicyclobacillus sacchari]|nr:hypothetical protein GCM10025858_01130 [Alicyclobacillus sacchari]
MIASAVASEPKVIFADEPTTALDSTVQMQVLALLTDICRKRGTSVVMVTHDLGVAAHTCDRIVVMYAGMVMEEAAIDEFLQHPMHPYTLGLRAASFDPDQPDRPLRPIPGYARFWRHPTAARLRHVVTWRRHDAGNMYQRCGE